MTEQDTPLRARACGRTLNAWLAAACRRVSLSSGVFSVLSPRIGRLLAEKNAPLVTRTAPLCSLTGRSILLTELSSFAPPYRLRKLTYVGVYVGGRELGGGVQKVSRGS